MFSAAEIIKATGGRLIQGALDLKFAGISTESRNLKSQEIFWALQGSNFDGHNFLSQVIKAGIDGLIVSLKPNFILPKNLVCIQVKNTTLALGALGAWQRRKFNLPVIAVTGSNGKTTTKEMLAWILTQNSQVLKNEGTKNNQIGLPQTLLKLNSQDQFAVVEIGTNHFGEVDYLAQIAAPNEIGRAHV